MSAPICILGMHRAHTSLMALMLEKCGVYLGPADAMLPPAPDNPDGFGEDERFVNINKSLLSLLGGDWDRPPVFEGGWAADSRFDELKDLARSAAAENAPHDPWAWKDPRTCLTFEFWRDLFPEVKSVVCVREPNEVAQSLLVRDSLPIESGIALWCSYYESVLSFSVDAPMIFCHSRSLFSAPHVQLGRVLDFLGLSPSEEEKKQAIGLLRPSSFKSNVLRTREFPKNVQSLYRRLCELAGVDSSSKEASSEPTLEELKRAVDRLQEQLEAKAAHHQKDLKVLRDIEAVLRAEVDDLTRQAETLKHQVGSLEGQKAMAEKDINALMQRVDEIQRNIGFRLTNRISRLLGRR